MCELGKKEGFSMVVSVQPMLGSSTKILSPSETIRVNEKDFLSGRLQTLDGMVEVLDDLDRHCTKTIDLTNVFDNVNEPIYLDGAHLYDSGNKIVAEKMFEEIIPIILDEIQVEMLKKAKEQAQNNTLEITDYLEFKSKIEKGGFFNSPWCGKLECEDKIKEETGAEIRVIPFNSEDNTKECIYCKEQSTSIPIFARGY